MILYTAQNKRRHWRPRQSELSSLFCTDILPWRPSKTFLYHIKGSNAFLCHFFFDPNGLYSKFFGFYFPLLSQSPLLSISGEKPKSETKHYSQRSSAPLRSYVPVGTTRLIVTNLSTFRLLHLGSIMWVLF